MAVLSIGAIAKNVNTAIKDLEVSHYDMRFAKPLDDILLHKIFKTHRSIITIEDGVINGGFGSAILEFAAQYAYQNNITLLGVPDKFIEQGTINQLQNIVGIDAEGIKNEILKQL